MSRRKSTDADSLLSKIIWTRVTSATYDRLESFVGKSDCHSVSEVARRILSKDKINTFEIDRSMDPVMEELSTIRAEINAIGVNINQITRAFHSADSAAQKAVQAIKVADQYKLVGAKVDRLFNIASELTNKWLRK